MLGTLKKIELRKVWNGEATDFTPWLAEEENIKLLGDTINIDLEVEGTEKNVGPFRADILCKDTTNDHWVLIENQLDKTDHTHLGQLLTYASGLNAVTIIWVAKRFTEEHRATLDWLNEITDESFYFFGIEIELWQIEDSKIAPHFKVVSQPNNWVKTIGRAASQVANENLTAAKKLQLEFWSSFHEYISDNSNIIGPRKARAQHWTNFAIGRSDFRLAAFFNTRDNSIAVNLAAKGDDAKPHFYLLKQQKEHIENIIGEELDWQEKPDKKESWIQLSKNIQAWEKNQWPQQHKWLLETLESFHRAFAPAIKNLNAEEYDTIETAI